MNWGNVQLAIREIRQGLGKTGVLITLAVVSILCALSGPFNTIETLGVFARTTYWTIIVFVTYVLGVFCHFTMMGASTPSTKRQVLTPFVSGAVIAVFISCLNIVAIPDYPTELIPRISIFVYSFFVAVLIAAAMYIVIARKTPTVGTDQAGQICKLLDRLPHNKRADLISLHAEDHYVRIETKQGSELVLMRLADAIELAEPFQGVRLHRSHWVVTNEVTDYIKSDNAWSVILSNGATVPISRGYRNDAIDAGIIPARG